MIQIHIAESKCVALFEDRNTECNSLGNLLYDENRKEYRVLFSPSFETEMAQVIETF